MTSLTLHCNQIGDAGAVELADSLRTNPTLEWLNLANNHIGDWGAVAIANALRTSTALKGGLALDNNTIGDAGAAALADALRINTACTRLTLENNRIGAVGAAALVDAVKANVGLQELKLDPELMDKHNVAATLATPFVVGCKESAVTFGGKGTAKQKLQYRDFPDLPFESALPPFCNYVNKRGACFAP